MKNDGGMPLSLCVLPSADRGRTDGGGVAKPWASKTRSGENANPNYFPMVCQSIALNPMIFSTSFRYLDYFGKNVAF